VLCLVQSQASSQCTWLADACGHAFGKAHAVLTEGQRVFAATYAAHVHSIVSKWTPLDMLFYLRDTYTVNLQRKYRPKEHDDGQNSWSADTSESVGSGFAIDR